MYKGYKVIVAPTHEPLSLSVVKSHLRVDGSDEDTLITALIASVRDWTERYLGRALLMQTITETYDGSPEVSNVGLRICPVQSDGLSVTYLDADGAEQTLDAADYSLVTALEPNVLTLKSDKTWPDTSGEVGDFKITYKAGYTDPSEVPGAIKAAMLLMIGDLFEKREDSVKTMPTAAEYLLQPYRIHSF